MKETWRRHSENIRITPQLKLLDSFINKVLCGVLNELAVPSLHGSFMFPAFIVRFPYRGGVMCKVNITLKGLINGSGVVQRIHNSTLAFREEALPSV